MIREEIDLDDDEEYEAWIPDPGTAAFHVLNDVMSYAMREALKLLEQRELTNYERGMLFGYFEVLDRGKKQAKAWSKLLRASLLVRELAEFDPYLLPAYEIKTKAKPGESPRVTALLAEIVQMIKDESEGNIGVVDGLLAHGILSRMREMAESCGISLADIGLEGFDVDSLL